MIPDFYIAYGKMIFIGGFFLAIIVSFFEGALEIWRGSNSKLKIFIRFASPLFVYLILAGLLYLAGKQLIT